MNYGYKICFVSGYYAFNPIGGAENQTYIIAKELEKFGYSIFFISPNKDNFIVHDKNITIFYLKRTKRSKILGSHYLFNWKKFLEYLNKIKPEILFQRGLSSLAMLSCHYARKNNIPFIYSASSDYDFLDLNLRVSIKYPLYKIDSAIGRLGIKNASAIIVQNNFQLNYLNTHYGRDAILIRNIYNDRIKGDIVNKKDQVICFCKYNKNKSPTECFQIAERLPEIKFIICGINRESNNLKKFTGFKNVPKNVHFMGILPKQEWINLLSESKILLSTSLFEGFPNTFIEAWMNKAAIVSLHVHPDNLFHDDKYGVYTNGDQLLAGIKINNLLKDPLKYKTIVEKSYKFAKVEFDLCSNIKKVKDIILKYQEMNY